MKSLVLLLGTLAIGCGFATAPGYMGHDYIPTALTKARHEYHGFSVRPPVGPDWHVRVTEQSPESAVYRRELRNKTHTFLASAYLVAIDPGLPFEQAAIPHGFKEADRNELLELTHERDTSHTTDCIRYSLRLLVKHSPNSPQKPLHLIDRGLVCAHPTIPETGVRASFSERGLPEELDQSLWSEFEAFLEGVQLDTELGAPAA